MPEYTVWFVRLSLLMMIVDTMGRIMCMAIHATGRIAKFQMIEANLLLLIVPAAYIALKMGYSPLSVFVVQLGIFVITQIVRVIIVCPAVKLPIWTYIRKALLRPLFVMIVASIVPVALHLYGGLTEHPLTQVFIVTAVSLISSALAIYYLGCDNDMRKVLVSRIRSKIQEITKA